MNVMKTALLMAALTALFILVGGAIGGHSGMTTAFMLACAMNLFSYWFSDKIVLRMYGAKEVDQARAPQLFRIVRELADSAAMPMPRLYVIPSQSPNAFATGRNPSHAAVAVTDGILGLLNLDELKGVLGHELSHVKNRDILIGTIAATVAGSISMLASMARWAFMFGGRSRDNDREGGHPAVALLTLILAPIAAFLIQMAISRSREYQADASGAALAGDPLKLASALRKLAEGSLARPLGGSPSTAHLFIVNPLRGNKIFEFFSTHPPMEKRIERLEKMAAAKTATPSVGTSRLIY
ncbi:MAG: zinc metalloprotease HtpX [Elusimicrobiota bacterium]